jgi:hypothetical protein
MGASIFMPENGMVVTVILIAAWWSKKAPVL